MYPNGIQFKNFSNVFKVASIRDTVLEFSRTNWQSWNICPNSAHMLSLRCLAFICVIAPMLKSKTSSLRSFKMTILFWQRYSFVRLDITISDMKDGQFFGHSYFRIWTKIMFNFPMYTLSFSKLSAVDECFMIKPTIYFWIPSHCCRGSAFHLHLITFSSICKA